MLHFLTFLSHLHRSEFVLVVLWLYCSDADNFWICRQSLVGSGVGGRHTYRLHIGFPRAKGQVAGNGFLCLGRMDFEQKMLKPYSTINLQHLAIAPLHV